MLLEELEVLEVLACEVDEAEDVCGFDDEDIVLEKELDCERDRDDSDEECAIDDILREVVSADLDGRGVVLAVVCV